jgi:hypothetical protein
MSIHRSLKFTMSLGKKTYMKKSKKRKTWSNYFKNTVH